MKRNMVFLMFFLFSLPLLAQDELKIVGWNVESGGATVASISSRIKEAQGVDVWGLSEVSGPEVVAAFETAAEDGEDAEFSYVLGTSGGSDRLMIIFNEERFNLEQSLELDEINIGGNVRAPLVVLLEEKDTGIKFYFMVNHLYRSRQDRRHQQSRLLNEWAAAQTLPVIAVGDYNFDWEIDDDTHDLGFDLLTAGDVLTWLRPEKLIRTQCTVANGACKYNSVLDFVFIRNIPEKWKPVSEIIQYPNDFPDNDQTSDHRQVQAVFKLKVTSDISIEDFREQLLERISAVENELKELKEWARDIGTH